MHRTIINTLLAQASRSMRLYHITQNSMRNDSKKFLLCMNQLCVQREPNEQMCKRFRHKGKRSRREQEDTNENDDNDDDDDNDDGDDELSTRTSGTKIISKRTESLRLDVILKHGLGVGRNKIDAAFYNSNIRMNEKKVLKKSTLVKVGDMIDLIRGRDTKNPRLLNVARVTLLKAEPLEEHIDIKLSREKSLLIEDYKDPWSGSTS